MNIINMIWTSHSTEIVQLYDLQQYQDWSVEMFLDQISRFSLNEQGSVLFEPQDDHDPEDQYPFCYGINYISYSSGKLTVVLPNPAEMPLFYDIVKTHFTRTLANQINTYRYLLVSETF